MGNTLSLALSIGVPIGVGAIIGTSLAPETRGDWYKNQLKKPSWNPPGWVFGPVWTTLYALMGYAAHRVWAAGGGPLPLGLYAAQLGLNFAWSFLFFKYKNLKAASFEITALGAAVAATIYEFSKVDKLAGQLLVPYFGWCGFATALTYWIWQHNYEEGKRAAGKARAAAADVAGTARAAGGAVQDAARAAGEAVHGAAAEATAQAATVFLAQGGERQREDVPAEVAEAAAARTRKED